MPQVTGNDLVVQTLKNEGSIRFFISQWADVRRRRALPGDAV